MGFLVKNHHDGDFLFTLNNDNFFFVYTIAAFANLSWHPMGLVKSLMRIQLKKDRINREIIRVYFSFPLFLPLLGIFL